MTSWFVTAALDMTWTWLCPVWSTHGFMVGMDNSHEVFLRKYDLLARSRENAFGENGQQPVLNGVTEYSQQSVLLHRGSLYVATNTAYDSQLIIRRYDPETGAEDNSFGVR